MAGYMHMLPKYSFNVNEGIFQGCYDNARAVTSGMITWKIGHMSSTTCQYSWLRWRYIYIYIYYNERYEKLMCLNASILSKVANRKSENLFKLSQSQLKVNVNFRIHRLHLIQYWENPNGSHNYFITQAHTLGLKCEFTEDESSESL